MKRKSIVFLFGGHVQGMNDSCSQSIVVQFSEDPGTEPDDSCLQEYEPPVFNLPGEYVMLRFSAFG